MLCAAPGKIDRMKFPVLFALAIFHLSAAAQDPRSVTKSISDDGTVLHLKYEVTGHNKNIRYSNQFDVSGWTRQQKDQLVKRVIDSLESNGSTKGDYLHKKIDDNGSTMQVWIEGRKKDQVISYNKSYDVKGKTEAEKNAIIDELLRGLGLSDKKD